jgi:50S ribosomal subunit-associated GTPase HflX
MERKLSDSIEILQKGGTEGKIIIVPNKIDGSDLVGEDLKALILETIPEGFEERIRDIVPICALDGSNIDTLLDSIEASLPPLVIVDLTIPGTLVSKGLLERLKDHSVSTDVSYGPEEVRIRCTMEERWVGHFRKQVERTGGITSIPEKDE